MPTPDKLVSFSYAENGQLLTIQRYQADPLVASNQNGWR